MTNKEKNLATFKLGSIFGKFLLIVLVLTLAISFGQDLINGTSTVEVFSGILVCLVAVLVVVRTVLSLIPKGEEK